MKTLTGSCLKIFSCKNKERIEAFGAQGMFFWADRTGFLELLIVAENLTQLRESDGNDASQMEKPVTEKSPAMVAESITEQKEESGFDTSDELSSLRSITCAKINDENLLSLKEESSLDADEGVPVIVPGLILMPEEASVHEEGKINVSNTLVESGGARVQCDEVTA